jgi:hypothetical protein
MRRFLASEGIVQRALEQDRAKYARAGKGRAGDDTLAHLMDLGKHLRLIRILRFVHPIQLERLGCAAAALIERCNEALAGCDLLALLLID